MAGLQPRRAQILDLIAWYEGQLERLQVKVRTNTPLEAEEIRQFGADAVVLATGSQPAGTGFQRALPEVEALPGVERPNVWPVEAVMGREARPGKRVLLLDDTGHWAGCGTAWHLAEQGHEVILVTAHGMVGRELERTAADIPLRAKLKQLGVVTLTESAIAEWHGDGATVRNLLDGSEERMAADALVLATANTAETMVAADLAESGLELHTIGDALAPRRAHTAIYEGRKLGLAL